MNIRVVSYTAHGRETAVRIAAALRDAGHDCRRFALPKFCGAGDEPLSLPAADWAGAGFQSGDALVFCCAAGIAVRAIAPWVRDKTRDSAVLVCGDTTAHAKPHPLPLQHAAHEAGFATDRCVYVGDDLRDIQAAHAAGMPAVAAAYGYVGEEDNISTWEAETCANTPAELWAAIEPLLPRDLR